MRIAAPPSLAPVRAWRRIGFACALIGVLALWYWGRARADTRREMSRLGPAMLALGNAGSHELIVNGQRLEVRVADRTTPLDELIARAGAQCQSPTLTLEQWISGSAVRSTIDPTAILQWQDDDEGFVGCLGESTPAAWQRLGASGGDLEGAGGARYLYARRAGGLTHVIAVRSQGSFSLARLTPGDGDAAGGDLEDLPRPPSSRRVIDARVVGQPERTLVYASAATARSVREHYQRALVAQRWTIVSLPGAAALQARRGDRWLVVSPEDRHGECWTSIIESSLSAQEEP